MTRSTSNNGPDEIDGIDLPSNAYGLGVDERGATHFHSALAHTVWVVENGEIAHEFDVDDLEDYKSHVAGTRGWDDIRTTDQSLLELVVEAVEQSGGEVSA